MATQPETYFVISDGTTTVTFMDGTVGTNLTSSYRVGNGRWAPKVARLRKSPLAGYGPYEDVEEEVTFHIYDTTAAGCYTRLDTLSRLIDQAERCERGENELPVLVKLSLKGATVSSTSSPLQARIKSGTLIIPPEIDQTGNVPFIRNVVLRFVRAGQWLFDEESHASSAAVNGDLATIGGFAAVTNPSPTRISSLTNFGYGKNTGNRFFDSIILIAEAEADIAIYAAEGLASGSFTSVDLSANVARNTNALRFTGSSGQSGASGAITLTTSADLLAVYVNVRGSSTANYRFTLDIRSDIFNQFTRWVEVPAEASPHPEWKFCGFVSKVNDIDNVYLNVSGDASSTIEFDTIVFVNARTVYGFSVDAPSDSESNSTTAVDTFDANHRLLTKPSPLAEVGTRPVPHGGDIIINTKAATMYGLHLGTGDFNNVNGDRFRQANNTSVYSNTWTLARRPAYLTPR